MNFPDILTFYPQKYVDLYCERVEAGLLGEPFNLFTNLLFIVIGIWQWRRSRRSAEQALGALSIIVGIGSAIFHSFATAWAQLCDIIPIGVLIFFYFYYYQVRILSWRWWQAWIGLLSVIAISGLFLVFLRLPLFNGSEAYFGVLFGLGFLSFKERNEVRGWLFRAFLLFGTSITARIVDAPLCNTNKVCTHFMWHIGCAAAITCAFKALKIPHFSYHPKSNLQVKNIMIHVPKDDLGFMKRKKRKKSKTNKPIIKGP